MLKLQPFKKILKFGTLYSIGTLMFFASCKKQEMIMEKSYTTASIGNISSQQIQVYLNGSIFEDTLNANEVITSTRELEFVPSSKFSIKKLDGSVLLDTTLNFKMGLNNKFFYLQSNPSEKGIIVGVNGNETPPASPTARNVRMINLITAYPDSIDVYFYNTTKTAIVGELKKVKKNQFSNFIPIETILAIPTNPNSTRSLAAFIEIKDSATGTILLAKERNKILNIVGVASNDKFQTIQITGVPPNNVSFFKLFSTP